jgi:hypothetical protein
MLEFAFCEGEVRLKLRAYLKNGFAFSLSQKDTLLSTSIYEFFFLPVSKALLFDTLEKWEKILSHARQHFST